MINNNIYDAAIVGTERDIEVEKAEAYMVQCFSRFGRPDGRHRLNKMNFYESVISGLSGDPQEELDDGRHSLEGILENKYAVVGIDAIFYLLSPIFIIIYIGAVISGIDDTADVSSSYENNISIQENSLICDVNRDGFIDIRDLALTSQNYGKNITEETESFDVNDDGEINEIDLDIIYANIDKK